MYDPIALEQSERLIKVKEKDAETREITARALQSIAQSLKELVHTLSTRRVM